MEQITYKDCKELPCIDEVARQIEGKLYHISPTTKARTLIRNRPCTIFLMKKKGHTMIAASRELVD